MSDEREWEPTKDEDRRQEPRREADRLQAQWGDKKLVLSGQYLNALIAALLAVNSWQLWTLGKLQDQTSTALRDISVNISISVCVGAESDPVRRSQRYEECRRGHGR